jgi:peptidoglycan/xylan/chitin deacetylase (PgdA/CDA1 family)
MYFVKTPWYVKTVYPSLTWDIKKENTLYLTFDDGPAPGITDEILRILEHYQAKATFFVIGENVLAHRQLYDTILDKGHTTGNHTMHHVNGWKTDNERYFSDVEACDTIIHENKFRPPYGRITYNQIQRLKQDYTIYMWDVLSGDFDTSLHADICADQVIEHATSGSIVVFHDSEKAKERVLPALPKVLAHFAKKGFRFESL